jgi:C_GCAxxG_C_C family probable redox protein
MRAAEEGVEHALQGWGRKLNCAEAVLRGVCHAQGVELTDQAMRMATPFGGGIGRSEDICGALAGGVLAIGVLTGRTGPDEDKSGSYEAAHGFHSSFLQRFGATGCRSLNGSDFESAEHAARCTEFVREACRSAIEAVRGRS